MNTFMTRLLTVISIAALCAAACGSTAETEASADVAAESAVDVPAESAADASSDDAAGIRLVSATEGAAIADNPPDDLVVLDVRTLEEFAEGHLDGATMLDFYDTDFAVQLSELDPDVPYLLYCRSGNRSGQTAAFMQQLGFSDVAEVDGGILSWETAGLPLTLE